MSKNIMMGDSSVLWKIVLICAHIS